MKRRGPRAPYTKNDSWVQEQLEHRKQAPPVAPEPVAPVPVPPEPRAPPVKRVAPPTPSRQLVVPRAVQPRLTPACQLAWTEAHRPRTLHEVVGNARAKERLLAALRVGDAVLLSGPTGIGKTSLAFAACAEMHLMVQTCDLISEDARESGKSLLQVQELLTRKGSEPVALVLDEVHLLSSAEKQTLAKLLKKRHGKRVICICDELDRGVDALKNVCTDVRMFASFKPGGREDAVRPRVGERGAPGGCIHAARDRAVVRG